MKYLIDTNILISAALFPQSVPAKAFMKAVAPPHNAIVCDYSMDELRRVYNRKFPHKIHDFEKFISMLVLSVAIVSTPPEEESTNDESKIRDLKDRPIIHAAIASKADVILTGDKDFLEAGVTNPKVMTAAEFVLPGRIEFPKPA
jgi:putative PIN family toxin of toxin-antitoxin system